MSFLGDVAPWINAALTGGPVGLAVKAAETAASALGLSDSSVAAVTSAVDSSSMSGAQTLALKQAEEDFKSKMQAAGYQNIQALAKNDLDEMAIVNATMVQELQNTKTETWLQANWRPLCGLSVAFGSAGSVVLAGATCAMAIFEKDANAISQLPGLLSSMAIVLAVPGAAVGITAWHKGTEEVAVAKITGATADPKGA